MVERARGEVASRRSERLEVVRSHLHLDGGGVDVELVDTKRCSPSAPRQVPGCMDQNWQQIVSKSLKEEHYAQMHDARSDRAAPDPFGYASRGDQ
jgi:hypothetical protein